MLHIPTPSIKAPDIELQTESGSVLVQTHILQQKHSKCSGLAGSKGRRWAWGSERREKLLAPRLVLCTLLQRDLLQGGTKGGINPFKLVVYPGIIVIM